MKKQVVTICIIVIIAIISFSFRNDRPDAYTRHYHNNLEHFRTAAQQLLTVIGRSDLHNEADIDHIREQISITRNSMKAMDFWMRYLEPLAYKQVNSPLPVEWETEVFEKFEKPYKRPGSGLTLATLYLDEEHITQDSLAALVQTILPALDIYTADSITGSLNDYHHFYLCNRLYLLNLAAIYTTGFECPDTKQIIPELRAMLHSVHDIYTSFNEGFPATPLSAAYLDLYNRTIQFADAQPDDYTRFDHFRFLSDYVNPLFALNQQLIKQYRVVSKSLVDYSLNKNAPSIFSKDLYYGQNEKGIFVRVKDSADLAELEHLGKLLFYDPILSGNNMRSCASCHKPRQYFTDTLTATALQYNRKDLLPRNTPSLINAQYNHLVMLDGKHFTLQHQTKAVITNPVEMGGAEQEVLRKVLSCETYKKAFTRFLKYTPQEATITFDHIASAITTYYAKFSRFDAPFDDAMNHRSTADAATMQGFNLFMGKAQCATCHFVPQFNGVKPPYVGSEFEVLGVPADTGFTRLSTDKGRYDVNPADETLHAFRTGTVRNSAYTMPYMHNGVFRTMNEVVRFYNNGGGAGRGLDVSNQTLSSDSLRLTQTEQQQLIHFISSLNERIVFEDAPLKLPASKIKALNRRKVGGEY